MSRSRLGGLLFVAAVLIVGLILWSRTRIIILVPVRWSVFVVLVAGLVLVVYLLLRMLFRR